MRTDPRVPQDAAEHLDAAACEDASCPSPPTWQLRRGREGLVCDEHLYEILDDLATSPAPKRRLFAR